MEDVERIIAENPDFPAEGTKPYRRDLSQICVWMVGHAHIDLGYRWDLSETIHRIAPWTFRGVLAVMDATPGFTFAQSQMFLYEAMEREYPALFARVVAAIADHRWEPVGGAWCEYDTALTGGEAVIRQHLYGMQYAADRLGVTSNRAAFVPDSFIRHPRTLPQILSGCGIEYYIFGRGLPQEDAEQVRRAFRWVGPDGRSVVAYLPFGPYSTPPMTQEQLDKLSLYADAGVGDDELVLYGTGDHGGGPRKPDIDALNALEDNPLAPQWRFGRVDDFLDAFSSSRREPLRIHERSLVAFATGALTSQAQIKRWNSRLERMLVETEGLLTCSTILQRKPAYPRVDLLQAWKQVMTLQFHDILPGTSVAAVYRRAISEYRDVHRALAALRADGVARIASRIDARGIDEGFVVVNPTGTPFSGAVSVRMPGPDIPVIRDPAGNEVALALQSVEDEQTMPDAVSDVGNAGQLLPEGRAPVDGLIWVDLPPFGYKLYSIESSSGAEEAGSCRHDSIGSLDVGRFRLRLDNETGDIDELFDIEKNRVLLSSGSNRLSLYDEHEKATSWVGVPDSEREGVTVTVPPLVAEENAVRTVVETTSIGRYSQFRRRIILYPRLARVDFELAVDWHEANAFLKVDFRPAGTIQSIAAGLPYGFEDVTTASGEFLVHRWIRLRSERGGFSLLNDGAYGADRAGGTLRMSVIRTVRDMDPEMSHGLHVLRYGLLPDEEDVSSLEAAYTRFAASPLAWWTGRHGGGLKTWGRIDSSTGLAAEGRFAASLTDGVALEVLKMPNEFYSPEGFVLRLRELEGAAKEFSAEVPLSCRSVEELDHLERATDGRALEMDGRVVRGRIAPYELLTIAAWL